MHRQLLQNITKIPGRFFPLYVGRFSKTTHKTPNLVFPKHKDRKNNKCLTYIPEDGSTGYFLFYSMTKQLCAHRPYIPPRFISVRQIFSLKNSFIRVKKTIAILNLYTFRNVVFFNKYVFERNKATSHW